MSSFLTDTLRLVSGNMIAQIIGILLVPIITHIYLPADYGIFQLFLSISSIIAIFSSLSYHLVIMLPKEDLDSANVVILCFTLITIITAISGIFFIIFSHEVGTILHTPEVAHYMIFLPIVVIISGLFSVVTYWQTRRKRFGFIATAQVINSLSSKTTQIGLGLYSASPLGLIAGLIVGYTLSLTVLFLRFKEDIALFKAVTIDRIKHLAVRYIRFPMFTSWSTVANTISLQLTPILLAFFFTTDIVGYYAVASMIVFLPMGLIGSAISQVFFQKACEERNRIGNIRNIVYQVQQRLISIGMFPMFMLIIMGPDLFRFFLGFQWSIAGEYAGILSPWILLVFIASPLSTIFSILERQTIDLMFNILILISRAIILVIGGIYGNVYLTLVLFSVTGVLFWGWMNLYILNISGINLRTGLLGYLKYFLIAGMVAIPVYVVKLLSMPIYLLFLVAGVITIVYYGVILLNDPKLRDEIFKSIGSLKG
jgi:lipopolysaccharide exporter